MERTYWDCEINIKKMSNLEDLEIWTQIAGAEEELPEDIRGASNEQIQNKTKLLDNGLKVILYFSNFWFFLIVYVVHTAFF